MEEVLKVLLNVEQTRERQYDSLDGSMMGLFWQVDESDLCESGRVSGTKNREDRPWVPLYTSDNNPCLCNRRQDDQIRKHTNKNKNTMERRRT